jgi:hypothetical protein
LFCKIKGKINRLNTGTKFIKLKIQVILVFNDKIKF